LAVDGLAANTKLSFVHFARPVPLGATVLSATLTFYMPSPGTGTKTITLKKVTEPWKAGTVTYATRPSVTTSDAKAVTMAAGTAPQEIVFDVKSHLQAVANGSTWYGWRLESSLSGVRYINAAQAADHKPLLVVEYAMKPGKPSGLAPGGGNAVSVALPMLRFNDVKALRALQVQINSTNDFSGAVSFDSGTVMTTLPQFDLSTTAFAGINNAETKYWRVRVQDDGGVWSSWSDVTSFTRAALPTLTLSTPTGNYVDEPTPTIAWSFSGTQKAWRVFVKDSDNNIIAKSDSGQRPGATASYEIPNGVIVDRNETYTIVVRVWDNVSRDGADNPWFQVTRPVTFRYSTTVAPVTSLVGTSLEPQPGVQLTWSRATAPDSFSIRRGNGTLVENVLAADVLVSGTNYQYIDYTAEPKTAQTWTVEAVVNGVTSDLNPVTASISPKTVGIWISDPETGLTVQLLDVDEGTWEMGEESAVFAPVGSNRSFKVTQAMRGYEGSISGLLLQTDMTNNKTVAQQEADVWTIKGNPNRTYILTLSDMAIPVVLGNVVVRPTPRKDIEKVVSFDFWQVRDLPFRYRP
jgi:hypothetical protein